MKMTATPMTTARTLTFIALLSCAVMLVFGRDIIAQQEPDAVTPSVSPQSLELDINPGESSTNVFRVTNFSDRDLTIEPVPKNFVPRGDEGAIDLREDDTPFSLAAWISVLPNEPTLVSAGQTADFAVTIAAPDNADPGGHFGSVVFKTIPDEDDESVAVISQEIAPVLLVTVPGDVTIAGSISRFEAKDRLTTTADSIEFDLLVNNEGNVHFKPSGNISVRNLWGSELATFDINAQNVIPGADRQMGTTWSDIGFRLGRYKAEATIVYGPDSQIAQAQTTFYVFPYQIVIPAALLIGLLLYGVYRLRYRLLRAWRILAGREKVE